MKKYFILAAAALVTLASCMKNDIDQTSQKGREINFNAVAAMATKTPLEGTTYGTGAPHFGVFSYALANRTPIAGSWDANESALTPYMDNVEISYDPDDKIWEPGSVYYWPLSGSLTFIGYSPYMASGVSYTPASKTLTFTNFVQVASADSQKDLMWATTNKDLQGNQSVYTPGGGTKTGVNIVFHHALSQVVFAIKKDAGLSGYVIKVKSISFNANSKATLEVVDDVPTWGASSENLSYTVGSADQVATDAAYVQYGSAHMPVPQTLTAGTQQFSVTYSLETTAGLALGQKTATFNLRTDSVTAWAQNTKYTYNLLIGLEQIYFNPTISEDWGTASSNVDVPEDHV